MKRFANDFFQDNIFSVSRWCLKPAIVTGLCMTLVGLSGCDMGTYNRRLKEPRPSSQSNDEEAIDDQNGEAPNGDEQQP